MAIASSFPALIEPVPVSDDFVQGIGKIEIVGPCARFIFFSEQTIPEIGQSARVIVRKLVVPMDVVPEAIQQTMRFMTAQSIERIANVIWLPRH